MADAQDVRPRRRRGPGVTVLLILAYGLAFLVALWVIARTSAP